MFIELLWQIIWVLIVFVLGVSKDMITLAIGSVEEAKVLTHEDGSLYTGEEKKQYVLNRLAERFDTNAFGESWKSTYSLVVELAWTYFKKTVLK